MICKLKQDIYFHRAYLTESLTHGRHQLVTAADLPCSIDTVPQMVVCLLLRDFGSSQLSNLLLWQMRVDFAKLLSLKRQMQMYQNLNWNMSDI